MLTRSLSPPRIMISIIDDSRSNEETNDGPGIGGDDGSCMVLGNSVEISTTIFQADFQVAIGSYVFPLELPI